MQDVLEAAPFLADEIRGGDLEAVEEELVRIDALAAHLLDLVHLMRLRSKSV